uniref:F-box protein 46 n=1 Tax=Myotis myotis TaxID=51298 RepID=A0A7J7YCR1_MYOMY|nr:F-box protein 46 [Myotis myotis]
MGFGMDVVVTGVVDECILFGKDGTKNGKEETVCLTLLPTRALAALKITCHHFKGLIEALGVWATDLRWSRDPPLSP